MDTRILLDILLITMLSPICLLVYSFFLSGKGPMARTNSISDPTACDEVLYEVHDLKMGGAFDGLIFTAWAMVFLAIVYAVYLVYTGKLFEAPRSGLTLPFIDAMSVILFLFIFKILNTNFLRSGSILIDITSLHVPGLFRQVRFNRAESKVWIERKSKEIHRCVISDGKHYRQLFINKESAELLRIWASSPSDNSSSSDAC